MEPADQELQRALRHARDVLAEEAAAGAGTESNARWRMALRLALRDLAVALGRTSGGQE